MNRLIKLSVCLLLMLGLLLCAVSCAPDENDEANANSEVAESGSGANGTEAEEDGSSLNDKGNLDSPNYGPIIRV